MRTFLFSIFICFISCSIAQTKAPDKIKIKKEESVVITEAPVTEPMLVADIIPEYPGGMYELRLFIAQNIKFPQVDDFMHSTAYINFTINTDGTISNIKILKGAQGCPQCDEEAIRVIKLMPKWKPGQTNGKPVATFFNLPIRFSVN